MHSNGFAKSSQWKADIDRIIAAYDATERQGGVVFYGASNFTLWFSMEADIPQYPVQNHGFGGSDDRELIDYAPYLLFPYRPSIVVFQTGSNDYVNVEGTDEEKMAFCMDRKAEMFDLFHEKLPNAHFVVLSGILLPGRSEYCDLTRSINARLKAFCDSRAYMTYVDAEALTYQNGQYLSQRFVPDGIHLTPEARILWANGYIIPALDALR